MSPISHVTEGGVAGLQPISYSIRFENALHKEYWSVNFFGDKQAVLCSSDGKVARFSSKPEALELCRKNGQT
jgi:hypothetical protein